MNRSTKISYLTDDSKILVLLNRVFFAPAAAILAYLVRNTCHLILIPSSTNNRLLTLIRFASEK